MLVTLAGWYVILPIFFCFNNNQNIVSDYEKQGWSANIGPAAELFGQVYANASQAAAIRGLATNVANYNGWNLASAPSVSDDIADNHFS